MACAEAAWGPGRLIQEAAGSFGGRGGWRTNRYQLAALLPIREQVSGPEHPDTLIVRADLARWTGEAGNAAGARDQSAAVLPVVERVSGLEHPLTQDARLNLEGLRATRTGPATSSPYCCPSARVCSAPSTCIP